MITVVLHQSVAEAAGAQLTAIAQIEQFGHLAVQQRLHKSECCRVCNVFKPERLYHGDISAQMSAGCLVKCKCKRP